MIPFGEVLADGFELVRFEEPAPRVVLSQHRNMRLRVELSALNRQCEHPLEGGELAVDDAVGGTGGLPRGCVRRMSAVVIEINRFPVKTGFR